MRSSWTMAGWLWIGGITAAAAAETTPIELASLRAQVERQNVELSRLRARLGEIDDGRWLNLAAQAGVAAALAHSELTDRQRQRISSAITREASAHGLDPLLLVALIQTESAFDCYAVSDVGAMGLMQVTPQTAGWLAPRLGTRLGRKTSLFDPDLNVQLGASYLADLLTRFGSLERALVAYNVGPALARKLLANPESRAHALRGYPQRIVREYHRLQEKARPAALVATTRGAAFPK
jgi:soluble lytic murein transglycosylase